MSDTARDIISICIAIPLIWLWSNRAANEMNIIMESDRKAKNDFIGIKTHTQHHRISQNLFYHKKQKSLHEKYSKYFINFTIRFSNSTVFSVLSALTPNFHCSGHSVTLKLGNESARRKYLTTWWKTYDPYLSCVNKIVSQHGFLFK